MVVTVDIFLKEDLLKLLKNRFIVIIGDSSKLIAALSHLDHIFYCYKILCHFHSRGNMHMMEHSTVALQVWKLFILTSNAQNYDDIIFSLEAWVIPMQHSFMGVQINCKWLWSCRILNHAFSPCLELNWRIEQCCLQWHLSIQNMCLLIKSWINWMYTWIVALFVLDFALCSGDHSGPQAACYKMELQRTLNLW